jgi:hypothetical protein
MRSSFARVLSLAVLASTAGCAAATHSQSLSASAGAARTGHNRDRFIYGGDWISKQHRDLFEMVVRSRGGWLQTDGVADPAKVAAVPLYVNGALQGDVSGLHGLDPARVRRLELLDGEAATLRYGPRHEMGAVVVSYR